MEQKICTECGRTLHISNFRPNRNSKDGYSHKCNECLHEIKTKAMVKYRKNPLMPVSGNSGPLAQFTPRQLMEELHRRGYEGILTYVQKIDLSKM